MNVLKQQKSEHAASHLVVTETVFVKQHPLGTAIMWQKSAFQSFIAASDVTKTQVTVSSFVVG